MDRRTSPAWPLRDTRGMSHTTPRRKHGSFGRSRRLLTRSFRGLSLQGSSECRPAGVGGRASWAAQRTTLLTDDIEGGGRGGRARGRGSRRVPAYLSTPHSRVRSHPTPCLWGSVPQPSAFEDGGTARPTSPGSRGSCDGRKYRGASGPSSDLPVTAETARGCPLSVKTG